MHTIFPRHGFLTFVMESGTLTHPASRKIWRKFGAKGSLLICQTETLSV